MSHLYDKSQKYVITCMIYYEIVSVSWNHSQVVLTIDCSIY